MTVNEIVAFTVELIDSAQPARGFTEPPTGLKRSREGAKIAPNRRRLPRRGLNE
jgi:hypothetical protein